MYITMLLFCILCTICDFYTQKTSPELSKCAIINPQTDCLGRGGMYPLNTTSTLTFKYKK